MSDKKFATAINCMDGRTQVPVFDWLKEYCKVDYVDMITEPGPVKILAEGKDASLVASIRKRVDISVSKHGSKVVAVVGHYDCAGNPVDKEVQLRQIKESLKNIQSWGFKVQLLGLWVDENWKVHKTN
jgi:hypothetical protein